MTEPEDATRAVPLRRLRGGLQGAATPAEEAPAPDVLPADAAAPDPAAPPPTDLDAAVSRWSTQVLLALTMALVSALGLAWLLLN